MNKTMASLLCTTTVLTSAYAIGSQNDATQSQNLQSHASQIEQRQDAFTQVETLVEKANDTLDGNGTNWLALEETSLKLTTHSQALLTLFPSGSQEGSKAKETVWSQPEKFNRLLGQMDQGFQELYRGSQSSDVSLAESGLEAAQDTCKSCHRSYRSRW